MSGRISWPRRRGRNSSSAMARSWTRRGIALLLLLALALTASAREPESPGTPPPTPSDYAPITLHVACGELLDAPCARVLPLIGGRTASMGIELRPAESGVARDTVAAVCQGLAAAAIGPGGAFAQFAHEPACLGRFDVVGRPLYPLYAFLVARAISSFRSL